MVRAHIATGAACAFPPCRDKADTCVVMEEDGRYSAECWSGCL